MRDFARIAWFWLNRGNWQGQQLLPASYFDEYMRPQTPKDLPATIQAGNNDYLQIGTYGGGSDHFTKFGAGIYGFNWWFNETGRLHPMERTWPDAPPDTVMAIGAAGNCAVLMPKLNLIVAGLSGDWGRLEAGDKESVLNHRLKLIAWAGSPAMGISPKRILPASDDRPSGLSGELKQWHRVTLSFRGPQADETSAPNPFTDYRLDVTFNQGSKSLRVPGYFAADGQAGETAPPAATRGGSTSAPSRRAAGTGPPRSARAPTSLRRTIRTPERPSHSMALAASSSVPRRTSRGVTSAVMAYCSTSASAICGSPARESHF